jgi:hypothetical protein
MREKDANTAWTAASDGTLEERVFYVQNWRSDVVALVNAAGAPLEELRYTAYGTPSSHPIADVNGDGVVGTADVTAWDDLFASTGTLAVYEHNNLDRDELFPGDAGDDGFFYEQYGKTPKQAYGVNALSYLGNRKGYAGYEWDETARTWHVRYRVLDLASGKWTRMDPLMYAAADVLVNNVNTHTRLTIAALHNVRSAKGYEQSGIGYDSCTSEIYPGVDEYTTFASLNYALLIHATYNYARQQPLARLDSSGLACTIAASCTLFSSTPTTGFLTKCVTCNYNCTETSRSDSANLGGVGCEDSRLPREGKMAWTMSTQICTARWNPMPTCPGTTTDKRVYYEPEATQNRNCSRAACAMNCTSVGNVMRKLRRGNAVCKAACKAAADLFEITCIDTCNSWCVNP